MPHLQFFPADLREPIPRNNLLALFSDFRGQSSHTILEFLRRRVTDCPEIRVLSVDLTFGLDSDDDSKRWVLPPLLRTIEGFNKLEALRIRFDPHYLPKRSVYDVLKTSVWRSPPTLESVFLSFPRAFPPGEGQWAVESRRDRTSELGWNVITAGDEFQ
ncbi:hypothetical protein SISSUDRAFT_1062253 [Sistotremastrum suecicum HHB10207 ss-3]|uniref:F-box domain-containing protein n=1 Tax=Sistotremastrum suecicum HHB10207 ss-3 TaxID=1314776 RepID=A0A166D4S2_9AGAM|nr:hypothetical protein SISSUDRAFT_1062253 [Sistotremastrum suecicum HHB10207 ss-3]